MCVDRWGLPFLWIALATLSSCQARYFHADVHRHLSPDEGERWSRMDSLVVQYLPDTPFAVYSLNMRQLRYFKNNVEERVLVTDYSRLHDKLVFFEENRPDLPKKFHRFELWLPAHSDTILVPGEKAALLSLRGKTKPDGRVLYELVHVYLGEIIEDTLTLKGEINRQRAITPLVRVTLTGTGKPGAMLLWLDKIFPSKNVRTTAEGHRIRRKVVKRHPTRDLNMDAYVQTGAFAWNGGRVQYVEVKALLDRNHNQIGAEKPMIFDFRQIFGEPLWLVRQQSP